jgi:hypothetical protein
LGEDLRAEKLGRENCARAEKRVGVKNRMPVFHTFLSAANFNKLVQN